MCGLLRVAAKSLKVLYTGPDLGTLILRLYYAESVLNNFTSRRLRHELLLFRTSTVKSDTNLIVGNTSRCFRAFPVMSDTEVSWRVNRQALLPLGAALCARQGLTGLDQVGTVRRQQVGKPCVGPACVDVT